MTMEQEIRFCTASDGVRIAWASVGEGPPLVKAANWLNHLEFDWQSPIWRHWFAELSRDHRLVRYDERGNGLSDWDVDELSLEAFVTDLETVVDAAGLERFVLLGISQGCAVSVAYAVRHPERVSHLVLFGGYTRGWKTRSTPEDQERRRAMQTLALQGWGQDNPAYRQLFTSIYVPGATGEEMDWFNELQRVSTSPQNAVRLMQTFGAIDVSELLTRVTTPTLVLHSRGDAGVPYVEGRALAAGIPGARFVTLESRNHLVLGHEPAFGRFLEEVRRFLGVEKASSTAPADVPRLASGQQLGRYRIESRIGAGGMGEVYRAHDDTLSRDVAIKILRTATSDSDLGARFEREARALAALSHPNIVAIYELGTERGLVYAVTELLVGRSLREVLDQGPLSQERGLAYAAQILSALREAHARGIVHRDLKPENLFLTARGDLKVLDFGIAVVRPPHERAASSLETPLTAPGTMVGTSGYMSPEQIRGEDVDPRSDIFSLGIVLYEMFVGRHPFRRENAAETLSAILRDPPPPAPWLPDGLERAIGRCLAKDPEGRWPSAEELEAVLRRASSRGGVLETLRGWLRRT
jgi:pimeloyl-ACP methyl ester carboxylesterase/tRNA A-37 threonylcarbamoyl transferase component Bud32